MQQAASTIDWPTLIAQLVTAIVTLAGGVGLYLRQSAAHKELSKELEKNTKATEETKEKTDAVAVSVEKVNQAQIDYDELYRLRRWKYAFDSLPECQGCKDAVEAMADRRRLRPRVTEARNAPADRTS